MDQFVSTETLIIELLLIASLVAIVVRRLRIPYTVALVVVGLILTTQSPLQMELTPELILAFFVPPLVFEAAFHLNVNELRRNLVTILMLAVPGVLFTTLIVGGILSLGTGIALPVAMVFGSLIAATDPVAVVALFRLLGVPERLSVLVEGESLLNDGTALVLFNLMLAIVVTGEFDMLDSVLEFARVASGGLLLGFMLGWGVSRLIARIDDYLIEITMTTVLAYGTYLLAEQMHFSGVLAVVAAGLITGNIGPQGMSPTTRIVLYNFWEYVTFLVNSLVFLLIGLEVDISALGAAWKEILWAIGAVLIARFLVIYGLSWISNKVSEPVSKRWRHVMFWGGLRGALSLALALSLPLSFGPDRDLIRTMAFGVALFTLLIQGTTMGGLVKRLGIVMKDEKQVEYSMRHARLNALRSAETHMERRYREGLVSTTAWERIKSKLQEQIALLADSVRELLRAEPVLEAEELETNRREILRALRSAYLGMRADGIISDEVFEKLSVEADVALEEGGGPFWFLPQESLPERLKNSLEDSAKVEQILIEAGSVCDEQQVKDIPWPQRFVIASLRRGNRVMIPKGDALMKAGDILMVVGEEEDIEEARFFCVKGDRNGEK